MWIIDSGASDHVFPYIKCFSDIRFIDPIQIQLPNRINIVANFSGTIILDSSLILYDVFFITEFKFSLISIAKLCHNYQYHIIFSHYSCHIQDVFTKKTIGRVVQHRNLYILHKDTYTHNVPNIAYNINKLNNNVSSSSFDIWHHRLGHPSNDVLLNMSKLFVDIKYHKNLLYHACHLAKQCRHPFLISNSTTSARFELLHMDILGPIIVSSLDGF